MTRGIKNWSDQFITELQGQHCNFKFPFDPNRKELLDGSVQVAVRPIQLFEIVFPEEEKDLMLNSILRGADGKTQHSKHNKFIWGIRKILGAEEIPEYKKDKIKPLTIAHTEIVGIGIKKDYWTDCRDGKRYDHKENEFCYEGL